MSIGVTVKKMVSVLLILMGVLLVSACEADTHYGKLQNDGKSVDVSDIEYNDEAEMSLDYGDDSRTLEDTASLSDEDEIDIPSDSLKEALSQEYDVEAPILYGDVRDIERLVLNGRDVKSIAGIEYFESLNLLDLSYNPRLTSIKGVEGLENLTRLDVSSTLVKKVDYEMPALERLTLNRTWVDIDESNIESLVEGLPALNTLDLTQTRFKINETVLSTWESIRETSSATLMVDYKQVDYKTVGFDAFWEFDDEGLQWMNPGIDVDVTLGEGDTIASGDFETLYVDIKDEIYHEKLVETLDEVKVTIGTDKVEEPFETTLLVYDYFNETMDISEEGSTSVLDAYEGVSVTEATSYEAMAMMFQYLGFPIYSNQITLTTFPGETSYRAHTLDVVDEEGIHAIGNYEYYMVGSTALTQYIKDVFEDQGYEEDDLETTLNLGHRYSSHDFKRDTLSEKANQLNIDFIFE